MQRSYVFYFQLLLQAAFFGSLYASKSEVKHINDQEDEFENYRSIPAGVHCREFALIYRDGHTVTVCVGGSVKMDKWIDSALSLQRLLSYRRDICTTQIIGSKSSGNSIFYVSLSVSTAFIFALNQTIYRVTALPIICTRTNQVGIIIKQAAK